MNKIKKSPKNNKMMKIMSKLKQNKLMKTNKIMNKVLRFRHRPKVILKHRKIYKKLQRKQINYNLKKMTG